MKSAFVKNLILDMLTLDDEPLDIILAEVNVSDETRQRLKKPFQRQDISEKKILKYLKELIKAKMVRVLNDSEHELGCYNIDQILSRDDPNTIWFRITELGKETFEKEYYCF